MAKILGSLLVTLGLDSSQFVSGTKRAQAQMSGFQRSMNNISNSAANMAKGLAAGFAFAGVSALASDAFRIASALQEAAAATGVTVEQLQRLRLAAQQNGSTADQMDASLSRLSVRLGEAQSGSKQAAAAFANLGISITDLKGLNAGDAFRVIAEKISAIKDPTLQAAAAKQIFGKSAAQLLPILKAGTAALDEATEASKRNGEISTEDAAKLDELADGWDMLKTRIGVGVANIIANTARGVEAFDNFFKPINQWAKEFDANVVRMASNAVASMQRLYMGVKTWIGDKLNAVWNSAMAKIKEVAGMFKWLWDVVVGHSYVPDLVDDVGKEFDRLDKLMVDPADKATKDTAQKFRDMATEVRDLMGRLFPELDAFKNYQRDLGLINTSGLSEANKAEARLRLYEQSRSSMTTPDMHSEARNPLAVNYDELDDKFLNGWDDRINDLVTNFQNGFAQMVPAVTDLRSTWEKAFSSLKEYGGAAFDTIAGNLEAALMGAKSFGDAIREIGRQLISMAMQALVWAPLKSALGIPGFANGTNFAPGGLAMVGERGPELVNLPRGAQVIPNHELGGLGGSRSVVINMSGTFTDERSMRIAGGQMARRLRQEMNGPVRA